MASTLAPLLLSLLAAAGCGAGRSPASPIGTHAWARPTPAMVTVGAAYLSLRSAHDDRLIAVTVPDSIAASTELHTVTRDAAGRVGMERVDGIALPAGGTVELRPGASHVMLLGLRRPLVAGTRVPLVLMFEHAARESLTALVRER